MDNKEFRDLKKKIIPIPLQDHFAKNREVIDNNIKQYNKLTKDIMDSDITPDLKAATTYMLDMGEALYETATMLLDHDEMAFFGLFSLRNAVDEIETTLNNHGIKIESVLQYKQGLRFVDEYIKHHSDKIDPL